MGWANFQEESLTLQRWQALVLPNFSFWLPCYICPLLTSHGRQGIRQGDPPLLYLATFLGHNSVTLNKNTTQQPETWHHGLTPLLTAHLQAVLWAMLLDAPGAVPCLKALRENPFTLFTRACYTHRSFFWQCNPSLFILWAAWPWPVQRRQH